VLRHLLLLLGIVLVIGCGRSGNPQPNGAQQQDDTPRAEIRLGDADYEAPDLPFKIVTVLPNHKLTDEAPFHAEGGDWTFFECETVTRPVALFTVGVMTKGGADGAMSSWGRAMLVVKDQETGTRLLELLAEAFGGTIPAPVNRPFAPVP
jgi:hypothetical protein